MATGWNSILILPLLISSLHQVAVCFEIRCNVSDSTVETVQSCPTNEQTYKEAAERKNCAGIQNKCKSFVYHCVRNREKSAVIEVCAPWLYIVDHVCGTYHEGYHSIRRTEESCNPSDKCPYRYNSTEQFKYQSCYQLANLSTAPQITTHHGYTTMETTLPSDPKETNKNGKEERQECSEFAIFSSAFGAALGSTFGLSCFWFIRRVMKKRISKVNDSSSGAEYSSKEYLLSPSRDGLSMEDGLMDGNSRHSKSASEVKYFANTGKRANLLDQSSNVTVYDNRRSPIRFSKSLTLEHVDQVSESIPEPGLLNINSITDLGADFPKVDICGKGDTLKQLPKIDNPVIYEKDMLIKELQSKIKKLEEENSNLKERKKTMTEK